MSFDTLDMARLRGLAGNKWQAYGDDVLPAWVADMDFQTAAPIRDYVARAGASGDFGYPFAAELESLPEVFAERARTRYGWQVDPGRVELIIDVVQGLYLGLDLYCRADQAAIIQTPIYPNFLNAANEVGRRALQNALVPAANGFEMDLDGLRAMIDDKYIIENRLRGMSPDRPVLRGTAQNPDVFFQARESVNQYYEAAPGIVQDVMDRFAKLVGRQYHLFDYVGAPDADRVIVMMGSGAEAAHEVAGAALVGRAALPLDRRTRLHV